MRRLLSLFVCLIALGGAAVGGVSAYADDVDAAYCPYGSVTGNGTWSPAETTVTTRHDFVWDTTATCTGGDDGGLYRIVFNGSAIDNCVSGNGSGTLTGSGPEGPITGTFTFRRIGIHLYISGDFLSGGERHTLQYWLDILPPGGDNSLCNYTTAPLIGHGVIADWTGPVPPPTV